MEKATIPPSSPPWVTMARFFSARSEGGREGGSVRRLSCWSGSAAMERMGGGGGGWVGWGIEAGWVGWLVGSGGFLTEILV